MTQEIHARGISEVSQEVPYVQCFSYASSDMAGQLVFTVISFYLLKFYTDIAGLSALVAGNILLLARMTDAVDAPVWGIIFEKTNSPLGKSRPWFLWLCVPFAVFGVLTFLTPNLTPALKIIYSGGTYVICSILYTGINTPVTSILSALTQDPKKRVMLLTYRMFGSKAGVLLVNASLLPLIAYFGRGNDKLGIERVMPIYALISIFLYLTAFFNLRENVPVTTKRESIKASFSALAGNWPWMILFSSCLFFWIAFICRISAVPYYFQYVWNRKDLIPSVNSLDVVSLGSIFLIPTFCKWTSKANVLAIGLAGSVAAQMIILAGADTHSLNFVLAGWIVGILTSGVALALPFSMLSESVDYGEWKSGTRAAGLLTAIGSSFCIKAGGGLGGAMPAWVLNAYHYRANVAQSADSLTGIGIDFIWLPAVFYALALIPVLFYGKFERMEPQIEEELKERRKLHSTQVDATGG